MCDDREQLEAIFDVQDRANHGANHGDGAEANSQELKAVQDELAAKIAQLADKVQTFPLYSDTLLIVTLLSCTKSIIRVKNPPLQ